MSGFWIALACLWNPTDRCLAYPVGVLGFITLHAVGIGVGMLCHHRPACFVKFNRFDCLIHLRARLLVGSDSVGVFLCHETPAF